MSVLAALIPSSDYVREHLDILMAEEYSWDEVNPSFGSKKINFRQGIRGHRTEVMAADPVHMKKDGDGPRCGTGSSRHHLAPL